MSTNDTNLREAVSSFADKWRPMHPLNCECQWCRMHTALRAVIADHTDSQADTARAISQHCREDLRGPCPDSTCGCDCHGDRSGLGGNDALAFLIWHFLEDEGVSVAHELSSNIRTSEWLAELEAEIRAEERERIARAIHARRADANPGGAESVDTFYRGMWVAERIALPGGIGQSDAAHNRENGDHA